MKKCLTLLICVVALSGCASKDENPFGPWDGFSYTRMDDGRISGRAEGTHETLNQCMSWVTLVTKRTGGNYYCGYKCETKLTGAIRCEKLMGYPI